MVLYIYVSLCLSGKTFLILQNTGTLDEHMHLLLPALIRLFKVDASVDIRRAAIKTLTRLIPRVQVGSELCPILGTSGTKFDCIFKFHLPFVPIPVS